MQQPEATDAEPALSVKDYNSQGHRENPQSGNGPLPSLLSQPQTCKQQKRLL